MNELKTKCSQALTLLLLESNPFFFPKHKHSSGWFGEKFKVILKTICFKLFFFLSSFALTLKKSELEHTELYNFPSLCTFLLRPDM